MENKKSNNLAVCIICGILTAFGIVASIISLTSGSKGIWMVNDTINILISLLICYYAFKGYQKPHGNLLKYIFLISTATYFIDVYQFARLINPWLALTAAIAIGFICHVAGRLHRVKQNTIFISIIVVLRLIIIIFSQTKTVLTIGGLTPLVIWIDIFVAYFLRYKEHKEAGLMDAPKE